MFTKNIQPPPGTVINRPGLSRYQLHAAALLVLFASGCADTPATHFYVLEAQFQPSKPAADITRKRLIGLGPITVPTLLERKQIVTRTDKHSVQLAEFHQWASPIKDNVAQVLLQNLLGSASDNLFRPYPWSAYGSVDYRIIIDITRFDTQPGKSMNLEATWAVMDEKNHAVIKNGQTRISRPLTDTTYPGTVAALSGMLGEFAEELALMLKTL